MSMPLGAVHAVRRLLQETVLYPPHPPRVESSAYVAIRHQMVVIEDAPCAICGVRQSTLGDPTQNLVGALALETHHARIEWALIDAIDLEKFNQQIARPNYSRDFGQAEMAAWIDHDRANLLVLCDVHHRHPLVGIHAVTYPAWIAQGLLKAEYLEPPSHGAGG